MMDESGVDSGVNLGFDFITLNEESLNTDLFADLFSTEEDPTLYYQIKSKPMSESPTTSFKSASLSRTNMKLYLQKERLEEQDRRERITPAKKQTQNSSTTNGSSTSSLFNTSTPNPTPAATVPVPNSNKAFGSIKDFPKGILKVTTRLQNPTHYHIYEEQKKQIKKYLNITGNVEDDDSSSALVQSMPNAAVGPSSSAPYMSSSAPSPDSPHSIGLSSSAATSASEADVIEDIMHLQEEINNTKGASYIQMSTVQGTNSLVDLFTVTPAHSVPTAKSCPSEVMPLGISNAQLEQYHKERQKKDNHNMIERRRRYNINDRIKELALLLPKSSDPHRQNKGTILKESVDYIKSMNKMKSAYELEVAERRRMEQENKKLKMLNQMLLQQQVALCPTEVHSQLLLSAIVKEEPVDTICDQELTQPALIDMDDDQHHFVNGDPMMAVPADNDLRDDMDFN